MMDLRIEKELVDGELRAIRLGHPLLDDYLTLIAARTCTNTVLAVAFDLLVFFRVVTKKPEEVMAKDVLAFIAEQRSPRRGQKVVRIDDGEAGLSARTIKRRLASVSGLFTYLVVRGDAGVSTNPVPRGLGTRSSRNRPGVRGVPLIRVPRTLPRVLEPSEVDAFIAALRTRRDRAMALAMVLGGLRRCEVLGLRLNDLRPGEHRVLIVAGKGGRERIVPVSGRFFSIVGEYLDGERPRTATCDRLFVVLKGPRRGQPLSAAGLDQIVQTARSRAGLDHLTCHQLRHTCFTRLREAGMALEAIQAQAGHASIESTRVYLHLANGWLADEYRRAVEAIEAEAALA
jgi:integrase/recombinase XerD